MSAQNQEFDKTAVYRIKRMQIGGYKYPIDYDEGRFIHVRVLEGPDESGRYKCTTRGEGGKHLGPGGGWTGESVLYFWPSDLERIDEPATQTDPTTQK